jgi:urease accessory protein UreH
VLTSQAALQIHPPPPLRSRAPSTASDPVILPSCNPATLDSAIVVERGGELHGHWDPVIPFAGAHVEQRCDLQIAGDSTLYWSEALMAGRISRGEAWQFATLAHELAVRIDGRTAYLERYRIAPDDRGVQRTWMAAAATHFAATIVRHPVATRETVEELHRRLAAVEGVAAAVDLVAPSLAVARVMTTDGASFGRVRASYRAWTLASIFGRPELAARK